MHMKIYLIGFVALLGFICPAYAEPPSPPKIISDGFATYKAIDASKAVDSWFAGSLMANDVRTKANLVTFLKTFEATNGSFDGYENVGRVTLSPSVRYYYVVFLYDSAPLYAWFEVYSTGGKDIITSYRIDPSAAQIIPACFFVKAKGD